MRNLVSRLKKVVLPAPFGPMSAWISPRRTRRSTSLTATKPLNCFVRPRVSRMKSSTAWCGAAAMGAPPVLRSGRQSIGTPWARSSELTVVGALHELEGYPGQRLDERIELRWSSRGAIGGDREPVQVLVDDHVGEAGVVGEVRGALLVRVDHRPRAVTADGGGRAERLRLDTATITAIQLRTVARIGNVTAGGNRVVLTRDRERRHAEVQDGVVGSRLLGPLGNLRLGCGARQRGDPHAKLWNVDIVGVGSKRQQEHRSQGDEARSAHGPDLSIPVRRPRGAGWHRLEIRNDTHSRPAASLEVR